MTCPCIRTITIVVALLRSTETHNKHNIAILFLAFISFYFVNLGTLTQACACGRLVERHLQTPRLRTFRSQCFCIEGWSSSRRPASEHSVQSVFVLRADHPPYALPQNIPFFVLFILFPLPRLSAEASSFAMKGAKNKTDGEHGCSFGRGNEHCPAFLFLTRSCLEGQLEGHLFFRADFARLVHGSSAFAGSMNISFPGTEVEGIAFD